MAIGGRDILEVLALENLISRAWFDCLIGSREKIEDGRLK
jgi:hypothetical protein